MKKRIFAFAAALVMTVTIIPHTALAIVFTNDPPPQQQTQQQAQVVFGGFGNSASNSAGFTPSQIYTHEAIKNTIAKYTPVNSDVKGWLLIPGTNMSLPIVQNIESNLYYESRDINKTFYPNIDWRNPVNTTTYLDFRVRFGQTWKNMTSRNTVIYGHNWSNLRYNPDIGNYSQHIMFAQLPSYTDLEFARTNPHIYFSTNDMEGIWRVFAVGYTELSNDFFYNNPNPGDEEYTKIINEWKARSVLNFGVDVNNTDRILTMSTCTRAYGSFDNQRFVVVARLLRPGETENDVVSVAVNPSPKQPRF